MTGREGDAAAGPFAGPGQMRRLCRQLDWAASALGPVESWAVSLRLAVRLCLGARFPMAVWAGPDLQLIYNQGYLPVLGPERHPWALGRPGREVWAEVWQRLEPEFDRVVRGAESTWHENQRFVLRRRGREEEAFFTYSLNPIQEPGGEVVGVLNVLTETTERVRSERHFERMFRLSTSILVVADRDDHLCEVNPAFTRVLGWSREEALSRPASSFVHPDDRARTRAAIDQVVGGRPGDVPFENRVQHRDGSYRHLSWSAVPVAEEALVYAAARDVTSSRCAQQELREREALLRVVLENSRDGINMLDLRSGRYVFMSPAQVALTGFTAEELGGITAGEAADRVHPDDRAISTEQQRRIAAGEISEQTVVYRWRVKSGEYRWFSDSRKLVRDADGGPAALVGVSRDVTEELAAADTLRRSEARYRNLFESIDEGFCVIEVLFDEAGRPVDYRFLEVNPSFERQTGLIDAVGRRIREFAPGHEQHWFDVYGRVAMTGEPIRVEQSAEALGRYFDVYAFRIDAPEQRRVAVLFNDISERRRSELALRELAATLESRVHERTAELERRSGQLQRLALELSLAEERERKRLAAILHDDLQQQLASIRFHLRPARRGGGRRFDEELAGRVDGLLAEAIEKSRNLSRALSPAILYRDDLASILRWLAEDTEHRHGLAVRVRGGPVPVASEALKTFLFRATQELLFNVVKHAGADRAEIRVRRIAGCIGLCVVDRGRGFDPDRIADSAGFGLLSIRERVELLGGRMRLRSRRGEGSRAQISVRDPGTMMPVTPPRPRTGAAVAHPGAADAVPSTPGAIRILIADDHRMVRDGLAALLAAERDVELIGEAADGREAVELAFRLRPDVVVMDVSMPILNGIEATRQIIGQLPGTRVIGVSMFSDREMSAQMLAAGARAYLSKGDASSTLVAAIRRAIAER